MGRQLSYSVHTAHLVCNPRCGYLKRGLLFTRFMHPSQDFLKDLCDMNGNSKVHQIVYHGQRLSAAFKEIFFDFFSHSKLKENGLKISEFKQFKTFLTFPNECLN